MGIVLSDADGTLFHSMLGSNASYTDEIKRNLAKLYEDLPPLTWPLNDGSIFKERVFVLHTGRKPEFNEITRRSMYKHFGIEHFRIVNIDFAGSHGNYVRNKIKALIELVVEWKAKKYPGEQIKIIDDDQVVIEGITKEFHKDSDIIIYTVKDDKLVRV